MYGLAHTGRQEVKQTDKQVGYESREIEAKEDRHQDKWIKITAIGKT